MSKTAVRTLRELVDRGLVPEMSQGLQKVADQFAIAITPAMIDLIERNAIQGGARDPIADQFVPRLEENTISEDERTDPIGDEAFTPVKGIVHRYPDRVLLKLLHTCPVYCRFCFRREKVGPKDEGESGEMLKPEAVAEALAYIAQHDEIWEVILTGGDPLMLSDRRLTHIVDALHAIPHVKVIRIHSRVPVVQPQRITDVLVKILRRQKPVYILLHCNHPRELTADARAACARLIDGGIVMLSQSVLLRGINDDVGTLRDLMRSFVECRVKPHYLHHPDLARGTGHFRLSLAEGQELMRQLRGHISGLCQPTYILDIPGGYGKVPVGPVYLEACEAHNIVQDYQGTKHAYTEPMRSARP